jgi:hypothetical protein
MKAAPQVLYPLGPARLRLALKLALLVLTLSLTVAVAVSQPGIHLVWVMGLLGCHAVWLSVRAGDAPGTRLQWDGQHWHLLAEHTQSGQLSLALDLQRALLLRWVSPCSASGSTSRWLWIEQDADPVIWMDVRRAIYWHAR